MLKLDRMFSSLEISASGLAAQRRRMNTIAENLANTNTTHTKAGGPYKRKIVRFHELNRKGAGPNLSAGGKSIQLEATRSGHIGNKYDSYRQGDNFSCVTVDIVLDKADPERVYDPEHPDADETGYVLMPKIDVIVEMVDMIAASRAYEANVTAIKTAKDMSMKALEI
ncbi:MAG: flagellar basal body rod protein FlgC [Calditrichota bacterium]